MRKQTAFLIRVTAAKCTKFQNPWCTGSKVGIFRTWFITITGAFMKSIIPLRIDNVDNGPTQSTQW